MALADRATIAMASWTIAEINVAVICACLVTINPILSRMFPRIWTEVPDTGSSDMPVVDTIGHAQRNRGSPHDSLGVGLDTNASMESRSESERTVPSSVEGADLKEKAHGVEGEVVCKEV